MFRAHLEASAERWNRLLSVLEELGRWISVKDEELNKQMPIGGDVPTVLQQQTHCTVRAETQSQPVSSQSLQLLCLFHLILSHLISLFSSCLLSRLISILPFFLKSSSSKCLVSSLNLITLLSSHCLVTSHLFSSHLLSLLNFSFHLILYLFLIFLFLLSLLFHLIFLSVFSCLLSCLVSFCTFLISFFSCFLSYFI